MRIVPRLLTACLLVCLMVLMAPRAARAGGDLGEDPYEIGEKLLAKKNYRTALKYYGKALKRSDARAHYRMALIYEETGKEQDALSHYRRFIDLGRSEDSLHGDAVQRVAAIEARRNKAISRTSELLERGKSLFKRKKYREAKEVLLQAAARDTSLPEVHFYLGEVYLQLEEYGKAKSEFIKAKQSY